MECLLCLGTVRNLVNCIQVDSIQWQEQHIKELIDKHIWPIESIASNSCLCLTCWEELHDFHMFYTRIEETHNEVKFMLKEKKCSLEKLHKNVVQLDKIDVDFGPKTEIDPLDEDVISPKDVLMDNDVTDDEFEIEEFSLADGSENSDNDDQESLTKQTKNYIPASDVVSDNEYAQESSTKRVQNYTLDSGDSDYSDNEDHQGSSPKQTQNDAPASDVGDVSDNKDDKESSTKQVQNYTLDSDDSDYSDNEDHQESSPKQAQNVADVSDNEDDQEFSIKRVKNYTLDSDDSYVSDTENDHESSPRQSQNGTPETTQYKIPCTDKSEEDAFLNEHFEITCEKCQQERFETLKLLTEHFRKEHREEAYVICCETKFSSRSLLVDHVHCHLNPDYFKCALCGKNFSQRSSLHYHLKTHIGKNHACNLCDKKYIYPAQLKRHKLSHKRRQPENNDGKQHYQIPKIRSFEADAFLKENFKLICDRCQLHFDNFYNLNEHFIKDHKERGYVICCETKFFQRAALVDHVQLHLNPEYFKCVYCQKVLNKRVSLYTHLKIHEGIKYTCNLCDKQCSTKHLLEVHKTSHLTDREKNTPCNVCGKLFFNETHVRSHQQKVHLKTFTKICEICGKTLHTHQTFRLHMRKHDPNAHPVKCDDCGRVLTSDVALKHHRRLKHPVGGSREYACHICKKVSPTLRAHKDHIKVTHILDYEYKCTLCSKEFKQVYSLKKHMLTHTGRPSFTCPWCPDEFASSGSLYQHRRKVHPVEWEESQRKKYSGKLPPTFKPL